MMRSMFSGVAGLRTHQTKMDVIGNNIANVNTVGFKGSSVTFKEIFSQTVQGATQANAETGRGGTNPRQIGLGVAVASIDNMMTQGAAQTTDNPLDLMMNGNAFFIVGDASGFYFTRAGAFRLDAVGNLVNSDGLRVYGWQAVDDPDNPGQQKISKGKVTPLTVKSPQNMYIEPEMTKNASFEGNINMDEGKASDGIIKTIDFYDSLGNYYKVEYKLEYNEAARAWSMTPASTMMRNDDPEDIINIAGKLSTIAVQFNLDGTIRTTGTISGTGSTAVFLSTLPNPDGTRRTTLDIPRFTSDDLGLLAQTYQGVNQFGDTVGITVDLSGMTQFESKTTLKGMYLDGCQSGELIGFSIGTDGIITGTYSNGNAKMLGQIAVANFKNPAGLEKIGSNLFVTTANSGSFDGIGDDPTYGGGSITGGCLEMSNVDLSREFTEMITTQRGFQANAKVITTSDEMLQELVRLK